MEQRRRAVVERPKGIGKLTQNGVTVAMVRYTLEKIREHQPGAGPGAGEQASRGCYEIRGRVWSLDRTELGRHEQVVLHLEDGRAVAISVAARDGHRGYPIVGTGELT
jgi:hypothetical protein